MAQADLVQRAKSLLSELAQKPRFAGSAEESAARALCRAELERAGFECRELPFEYSQWPGRWGPPIAAALQAATVIIVARVAMGVGAFSAILVGAALITTLFFIDADAKRRLIGKFPFQRAHSVNLEARRGNPTVWLVAHLDSKSQTMPMLIRVGSSIALAVVTVVTFVILGFSLLGLKGVDYLWPVMEVVIIVAVLPSLFCFVRNDSNGAVDNASGIAAVLLAAQSASAPRELGVLMTSGEEFGLAGARAWASASVWAGSAEPRPKILNCDTVDDAGDWRCMYTGPRPKRIAAAAETVAGGLDVRLSMGRLIPGILADSMAFADLGIEAVTLSRGTLSTLARIHTRRDNSNAFGGKGAAEASVLLTALAKELG